MISKLYFAWVLFILSAFGYSLHQSAGLAGILAGAHFAKKGPGLHAK
jgi:hypothetical protein